MNVHFEKIEVSHQSVLYDFLYLALFVPQGMPKPERTVLSEPVIKQYVKNWGRVGDAGFLALDKNKIVGAAWVRRWSDSDKGFGYINDQTPELTISILPEYRGQGIGTSLLKKLIITLKRNYGAISLSVHNENQAKKIYEKIGFKRIKEEKPTTTMILYL